MKLDSENNENKILLLYTLSKIGRPISHNEFLELVSSITDMNYFVFQEFILDLIEDGCLLPFAVESANRDKQLIYERRS